MRILFGLFAVALVVPSGLVSQGAPAAPAADVASVDAIVAAVYDAISGPAGDRDWDRFRALFTDDARLIPTSAIGDTAIGLRVLSVDQYVERVAGYFARTPFYERQVAAVTEHYGHIAHVFSTYESLSGPEGPVVARGINSFQLFFDGNRWWVVSVLWDSERTGGPIPERYGGGPGGA